MEPDSIDEQDQATRSQALRVRGAAAASAGAAAGVLLTALLLHAWWLPQSLSAVLNDAATQAAAGALRWPVSLGLLLAAAASAAAFAWACVLPAKRQAARAKAHIAALPTAADYAHVQSRHADTAEQLDAALDDNLSLRERNTALQHETKVAMQRFETVVRGNAERVVVTDAQARVLAMSTSAATLLGLRLNEVAGRPSEELIRLFDAFKERPQEYPLKTFVRDVLTRASSMPTLSEVVMMDSRNQTRTVMLSSEAILGEKGEVRGALLRINPQDEASERDDERQAAATGLRDSTTDLPTRGQFDRRLAELIHIAEVQEEQHQLLLIAVDSLQRIYDRYGYWAGEELLWAVARRVRGELPATAELFRITSLHFALLLPFTPDSRAEALAETLRLAVEGEQFAWQDQHYQATVSIAVAAIDAQAGGTSAVVAQADADLRLARSAGGNRVQTHQVDELLLETQAIEQQLLEWLDAEGDNSHLQMQSRELTAADSSRPALVEALLQVEMEDGFWVDPAAFQSSAENLGLSYAIDTWLLRHSLATLHDNPELGERYGPLLVHLAGASLRRDGFVDELVAIIGASGVAPQRIVLLVDEVFARSRPAVTQAFRDGLDGIGAQFGLRHCRLGALADIVPRLQPQFVGLPPALVRKPEAQGHKVQFNAYHALAQELGFATFATDVGDADRRRELQRLGVDYVGDKGSVLGPLSSFGGLRMPS